VLYVAHNQSLFFEDSRLYSQKGEISTVTEELPLGKAIYRTKGNDVSVITYSVFVKYAEAAAQQQLARNGLTVEVLDLVSIQPLDEEKILQTAAKTKRVLVVGGEPISSAGIYYRIYTFIKESLPDTTICYVGPQDNILIPFGQAYNKLYPSTDAIVKELNSFIV